MVPKKPCWKTSVGKKLHNNEQAIMAMTMQNSWTASTVWKYNSSKINTEENKQQEKLPDEIGKPQTQSKPEAKKPSQASTKKYTGKYPRKNEIYQNNWENHFWDNKQHSVVTCWRWNFKITWTPQWYQWENRRSRLYNNQTHAHICGLQGSRIKQFR